MTVVGKINRLKVIRQTDEGVCLDGGTQGEILLPRGQEPRGCQVGDVVEVFVFFDPDDRIAATTFRPHAMVGDFALLKVVSVSPVGAFLDWGLDKDLMAPFKEQKTEMLKGRSYIVYVYLDNSGRIAASSRLEKFLDRRPDHFHEGQEVGLFICSQTEIGYKAIIDNSQLGILYKNEVFQPLKKGQHIPGFIKKIRPDGKIDLCLQKAGPEKVDSLTEQIIERLKKHRGFLALTDKSSPDIIYTMFGASKKTYKKAIGGLYKKGLISIKSDGIELLGEDAPKGKPGKD